jgi:UDP-GlcNAc:undecaprenyl-phosphate/decaprenyl-phosphate GlcNAc-1-phosphate transferase
MHALPFALALATAALLAAPLLRALSAGGHERENFRGRALPFPFGVLIPAAALVALVPLTLLERLASAEVFHPETLPVAAYALGVLTLGLIDDALGGAGARSEQLALRPPSASREPPSRAAADVRGPEQPPRGWRGHGAAALRGEWSTGALKGAGSLGLALFAVSFLQRSDARWLLAAAVVVLATNLFNLLDLRPGRAIKAFVLLGAGLLIGSGDPRPLWAVGLFAAPALVAGSYDVRERAMLGDTGASLVGALAGLWIVLTLSSAGQIVALGLLLALTIYSEFRSLSALIERTPWLRGLDSWGRPS